MANAIHGVVEMKSIRIAYLAVVFVGVAPLVYLTLSSVWNLAWAAPQNGEEEVEQELVAMQARAAQVMEHADADAEVLGDLAAGIIEPYDENSYKRVLSHEEERPEFEPLMKSVAVLQALREVVRQCYATLPKNPRELDRDALAVHGKEIAKLSIALAAVVQQGVAKESLDELSAIVDAHLLGVSISVGEKDARQLFDDGKYKECLEKIDKIDWQDRSETKEVVELQQRANFRIESERLTLEISKQLKESPSSYWTSVIQELRTFEQAYPQAPHVDDRTQYEALIAKRKQLNMEYTRYSLRKPIANSKPPLTEAAGIKEAVTTSGVILKGVFESQQAGRWYKYWRSADDARRQPMGYQTVSSELLKQQPTDPLPAKCIADYNRARDDLMLEIGDRSRWEAFKQVCEALEEKLKEHKEHGGEVTVSFRDEMLHAQQVVEIWNKAIEPILFPEGTRARSAAKPPPFQRTFLSM